MQSNPFKTVTNSQCHVRSHMHHIYKFSLHVNSDHFNWFTVVVKKKMIHCTEPIEIVSRIFASLLVSLICEWPIFSSSLGQLRILVVHWHLIGSYNPIHIYDRCLANLASILAKNKSLSTAPLICAKVQFMLRDKSLSNWFNYHLVSPRSVSDINHDYKSHFNLHYSWGVAYNFVSAKKGQILQKRNVDINVIYYLLASSWAWRIVLGDCMPLFSLEKDN